MNIDFEYAPERIGYIYGKIYNNINRDSVINKLNTIEDVYMKKVYYKYEIYTDSTIDYKRSRSLICLVEYNDKLGYMYLPREYFQKYINPILDDFNAHNQKINDIKTEQRKIEQQKRDELIKQKEEIRKQKEKEEKEKRLKERTKKFVKMYGKKYGKAVAEEKIMLGMTTEMVIDSWGRPEDINRSVGSWGVHEQWVYGDTYVYFENDKLTSWQD